MALFEVYLSQDSRLKQLKLHILFENMFYFLYEAQ